jgi:hypothetical protein
MAMLEIVQIVTVVAVTIVMSLPLAHALEWPGKQRLSKEHYLAMRPIYYPGFTYAGFAEPLSLLVVLILLILTPRGTGQFWSTAGAFLALLTMHASYWVLTHPVNYFWLEGFKLQGFARRFFEVGVSKQGSPMDSEWTHLRDRWEFSHMIRAILGLVSLVLIVVAVVYGN